MDELIADAITEARRNHAAFGRRALPPGSTDLMYLVMHATPSEVWGALQVPDIRQSVNVQNVDGMTALMYAARDGKSDIVDELKRAGANTGLTNTAGKTAKDFVPDDLAPDTREYMQEILQVGGRRRRRKTRKGKKSRKSKKTRKTT